MRFQREPGVWVMEADEHGDKHGFEECPPDAKDQLLMHEHLKDRKRGIK
jgi:hypothetical protein